MQASDLKSQASQYLEARDWENLSDCLMKLITVEPKDPSHLLNLATTFERVHDADRQLATLKLGIKRFPNDWKKFADRTQHALFMNQRIDEAFSFIAECLESINGADKYDLAVQVPASIEHDTLKRKNYELLSRFPNDSKLKIQIARQFLALKLFSEAEDVLREAEISHASKMYSGLAVGHQGRIREGLALLDESIERAASDSEKAKSYRWRAEIMFRSMRHFDAIADLELAISLDPTDTSFPQALYSQLHYSDNVDASYIKQVADTWNQKLGLTPTRYSGAQTSSDNLRIGFISQGFKIHPVGWMSAGLFCELVKYPEISWHIFDLNPGDDYIAKTIRAVCPNYYPVSDLSDNGLYDLIKSQNLDALIDCDGFQGGNRLPVILRKPSRTNIKWIGGLVGSTYLKAFDYLVTDTVQTPLSDDELFSEQLIRMPSNYVTYTPPPYRISISEAPVVNNDYVTFGCFNNGIKVSQGTIRLWSNVLSQVQGSKLLLKDRLYDWKENQKRLTDEFARHGIQADQLIFLGGSSHEGHLNSHNRVDICLDPVPYSGGLCTLESAFMGVPVIALAGRLLCHRHSATHLTAIGHPELISNTQDHFVELAVALANDRSRIIEYRTRLRDDLIQSPLTSHEAFTTSFVDAIKKAVH